MSKPYNNKRLNPNHKIGQRINLGKSCGNKTFRPGGNHGFTKHNSMSFNEFKQEIEKIKSKYPDNIAYKEGLKFLAKKEFDINKLGEELKIELYQLIL